MRKFVFVDEASEISALAWDAASARVGVRDMRLRDEVFERQREERFRAPEWTPEQIRRMQERVLDVMVLPPGVTWAWQDYRGRWHVRVRAGTSPA